MIIHDLDIFGAAINPSKAYAPLIVDANGPLAAPVSPQSLESISRRRIRFADCRNGVKLQQLAARDPFDRAKLADILIVEQAFRLAAGERT
jgi:hypothetical protein